ncbi:MAG TPA: MBL fold metallo-hydrolase [Candidatus Merdivicinus excrementipullorum]|uniref:MBL fold metallo-hydrolase n=1 Tax=Candidatus Merdivicinus excrementipullorum TaxID=2840867 RepID=A0A9D1FNY8_9FIRM|nr:MBL fold metallo-hydrolase [Candidatus Merdivicinus excrementipullorum]
MTVQVLPVGEIGTNCYFVVDSDGSAAILDPGAQAEKIIRAVEQNGWTPKMILLTHGHFDHIGAVEELRNRYCIPVYIHQDDAEMLDSPEKNGGIALIDRPVTASYDNVFEDGSEIPMGNILFRVIHTPGHTKGSVCYLAENWMFSGDTLFNGGIGRTDLYGGSYPQLSASLKKLAALEGDFRVCPGHGPETSLEQERRQNPYLGKMSYDDLF